MFDQIYCFFMVKVPLIPKQFFHEIDKRYLLLQIFRLFKTQKRDFNYQNPICVQIQLIKLAGLELVISQLCALEYNKCQQKYSRIQTFKLDLTNKELQKANSGNFKTYQIAFHQLKSIFNSFSSAGAHIAHSCKMTNSSPASFISWI